MNGETKWGYDEPTTLHYFTDIYNNGKYSVGSFWCMFSYIHSYILVKEQIDIKTYVLLKKLLKGLTAKHLALKADVFSSDEMVWVFCDMFDEDDPKQLGQKVAIAILYYGLMCHDGSKRIEIDDVRFDISKGVEVEFP